MDPRIKSKRRIQGSIENQRVGLNIRGFEKKDEKNTSTIFRQEPPLNVQPMIKGDQVTKIYTEVLYHCCNEKRLEGKEGNESLGVEFCLKSMFQ